MLASKEQIQIYGLVYNNYSRLLTKSSISFFNIIYVSKREALSVPNFSISYRNHYYFNTHKILLTCVIVAFCLLDSKIDLWFYTVTLPAEFGVTPQELHDCYDVATQRSYPRCYACRNGYLNILRACVYLYNCVLVVVYIEDIVTLV